MTRRIAAAGVVTMASDTPTSKAPRFDSAEAAAEDCGVNHLDATCEDCGATHVQVGWAHVCRDCWDRHLDDFRTGGTAVGPTSSGSTEAHDG